MERPKLSSFATLLRSSTQLYSAKAPILFLINFIILVPMLLIISVIAEILKQISRSLTPTSLMSIRVAIFVLFLLFALVTLVSSGALIIYITRSFRGETVSALTAYQMTLKRFSEYLKVNIFYGIKILVGGILLLLPGLYFGFVHVFAPLLVLVEGTQAREAMARSKAMVAPHLFLYTDYLLFAALTALISSVPFVVILNYLVDWSMLTNHWRLAAVADFATMCVGLMVTQFILVFYVRFYEELKAQPSASAT